MIQAIRMLKHENIRAEEQRHHLSKNLHDLWQIYSLIHQHQCEQCRQNRHHCYLNDEHSTQVHKSQDQLDLRRLFCENELKFDHILSKIALRSYYRPTLVFPWVKTEFPIRPASWPPNETPSSWRSCFESPFWKAGNSSWPNAFPNCKITRKDELGVNGNQAFWLTSAAFETAVK